MLTGKEVMRFEDWKASLRLEKRIKAKRGEGLIEGEECSIVTNTLGTLDWKI